MRFWKLLIMICLLNLVFHDLLAANHTENFRVIINKSVPYSSLTKRDLSNIFLKKLTKWSNSGEIIFPVDQLGDSPVRTFFSQYVHEKKMSAVRAYWQQQIFSGRKIPPLEKSSDQEVIEYVEQKSSAIGYVSESVDLSRYNVKIIEINEE